MSKEEAAAEAAAGGKRRRQRLGADRWAELIAEQANSGLSVLAFCRDRGLAPSTFQSWKRRLGGVKSSAAPSEDSGRFVRLEPREARAEPVEAELPCGTRLRVPENRLAELVVALRRESG